MLLGARQSRTVDTSMSPGFAKPMPGQPPGAPRAHPKSMGANCLLTNEMDS